MVEISNSDIERIMSCLDIAIEHYKVIERSAQQHPRLGNRPT